MPGAILASRSLRHSVKRLTMVGGGGVGTFNVADTIFTITGTIWALMFNARVILALDNAGHNGTIICGVVGNTNSLITVTNCADLNTGLLWKDATPETGANVGLENFVICANVIQTVGVADQTEGVIEYSMWWLPMSFDGNVG